MNEPKSVEEATASRWDNQSYAPDPAMLDQIECEIEALSKRAQHMAARLNIDEKQAFWSFTLLYLEAMKLDLK